MMFRHHDDVWRDFPGLAAGALLAPDRSGVRSHPGGAPIHDIVTHVDALR